MRKVPDFKPRVALVLGSGLGDYADTDDVQVVCRLPYTDIEGFPVSTVPGHKGQFIFGYVKDVPVVIMQGRVHFYEGYPMSDVVLPARLMRAMGAEILFLTNAAGGCNPSFMPGELMLITDHIACLVPNPLLGPNCDTLGTRFPGMSEIYNKDLRKVLRKAAADLGVPLQQGVYVQFTGPSYESPAEIRMAQRWGGDAVGMSTACEAIAANHMGMKICGVSCITNLAAGMGAEPNHAEVQEVADRVSGQFKKLVTAAIAAM